jgi:uncharacterized protein YbjT (DUF2867 family)
MSEIEIADVFGNAVEAIDEWLAERPDFADPPFSEVLDAADQAFGALCRLDSELDVLHFRKRVKLTGPEAVTLRTVVERWDHDTCERVRRALKDHEEGAS